MLARLEQVSALDGVRGIWRRGGDSNPRYRFWPLQRFSKKKLPGSTAWCSEQKTYARVTCPILVQNTPVWSLLCNHCATRKLLRFQIYRRFRTPRCLELPVRNAPGRSSIDAKLFALLVGSLITCDSYL